LANYQANRIDGCTCQRDLGQIPPKLGLLPKGGSTERKEQKIPTMGGRSSQDIMKPSPPTTVVNPENPLDDSERGDQRDSCFGCSQKDLGCYSQ
jgi:hypothetical protein